MDQSRFKWGSAQTLPSNISSHAAAQTKTLTRIELLDAVYMACPSLSRAQAREIFEMTLKEIVNALLREESVKLHAFGVFNVRSKSERIGRNPRTGVEATITARRVMTFKASPTLIARCRLALKCKNAPVCFKFGI